MSVPWWIAVLLAVASYVVLHSVATAPPETFFAKPGDIASMATGQMMRTAAMAGQYVLPLLLLIGATSSVFARRFREKLIAGVHTADQAEALRRSTP